MNIAIFTDTYFPQISGVAASIATLEKELTNTGHQVYIFTSTDRSADLAEEEGKVFRFPSLGAWFVPERRLAYAGMRKASRLMETLEIDLVHTHTEFSMGLLGKYVANKHNVPFVHTYHTMYEDYLHYIAKGKLLTPKFVGKLTKYFCKGASLVIAPTDKVRRKLISYGVEEPIKTIPTGISFKQFRRTETSIQQVCKIKETLHINTGDKVVVSIGRMAEEKNMQAIIRALPNWLAFDPTIKLVMVGDGPVRESLEALARAQGVHHAVRFVGAVNWDQVQYYYHIGDVFVSASTTEAQGLTYIEAIASGCIVVAKEDQSVANLLMDGQTGFLFRTDEDLGPLLREVFARPQQLKQVRQAAKKHIQPLSAEAFGQTIVSMYRACMNAHRTSTRFSSGPLSIFYRKERSS
ncbi:glycosyltransferase family 4 protein [Shouchella lonarensis]|uniref:1,2-diacylglycerol 3-glucosyltransferase n=1 Tax=Shouchella lonarensis TaxID=1464122 RepID=A0A1G6LFJ1_9BACI|nr:glycosyltransferase family 4 protein [Shouchella lonarensis]SDC42010.1 1,2-diacylglycerol 3-glucosyltransferase [Shouchella lonarensis]